MRLVRSIFVTSSSGTGGLCMPTPAHSDAHLLSHFLNLRIRVHQHSPPGLAWLTFKMGIAIATVGERKRSGCSSSSSGKAYLAYHWEPFSIPVVFLLGDVKGGSLSLFLGLRAVIRLLPRFRRSWCILDPKKYSNWQTRRRERDPEREIERELNGKVAIVQ